MTYRLYTMSSTQLDKIRAKQVIQLFMKKMRNHPTEATWEIPTPNYFYLAYRHNNESMTLPLGWIGTRGCTWRLESGCTMCDYGGFDKISSPKDIRRQIQSLFEEWDYPAVANISAPGSIFDTKEVPYEQRKIFFQTLGTMPNLKHVGVESRPDQINYKALKEAIKWLGTVTMDVGLGLESVNEIIRNVILNKALDLPDYCHAVNSMLELNVSPVTHILFKAPLLTDREAIEDSKETIHYALDVGSERIVLMLSNIKNYTLSGWLHNNRYYRVPWLWSVLRMLLDLEKECLRELLVYGFECGMPMVDKARNCPKCTPLIRKHLDEFNFSGDRQILETAWSIRCKCREDWGKYFYAEPSVSLETRIVEIINILELSVLETSN